MRNAAHMQRAEGGIITIKIQRPEQKCPSQWKQFMYHGVTKEELTHLFAKEWTSAHYSELIGNHPLYLAHGAKCTWIIVTDGHVHSTEVLELYSTQMQGDTHIFLHKQYASYTENAISLLIMMWRFWPVHAISYYDTYVYPFWCICLTKVYN